MIAARERLPRWPSRTVGGDQGSAATEAVDGQPQCGSCWRVRNRYTAIKDWQPEPPDDRHPVACTDQKSSRALRRRITLMAVPRTRVSTGRQEDPYAVYTAAGVTPQLQDEGWFLVRFHRPVINDAFEGFTHRVFAGQLPADVQARIADALRLPQLS